MPAINKELLHQGYNFAIACYDAGIDATPVATWLSDQARLSMANPAPQTSATPAVDFDTALATALESSGAIGVDMTDLRVILKSYGKTASAIGAALGRMKKAGAAEQRGNLWFAATKRARPANVDQSIGTRRRGRRTGTTGAAKATPANTAEAPAQAAAAG